MRLVEEITQFTTLTLDYTNFVQVFQEGLDANQYKLLDFDAYKAQKSSKKD